MNWIKRGNENTIEGVFLRNLGISSTDDVNDWFRAHYSHKYTIDKLAEAARLILEYKDKPIHIAGDYDVDGITSTSILRFALHWAGCKNVDYDIPLRFSEGFGINRRMIDEYGDSDALIITCDNGIAQIDSVNYAKDKGFKVIILDHHLPETGILPNADIIIDPNAIENSAVFNGYCGAGLCYKLAEILLNYDKPKCTFLLSLAALGTVADVMNLREENYVIVRNGLKQLISGYTTPGIKALIKKCGFIDTITAKDIGFKIGPILNSCSRLKDNGAKEVVEFISNNLDDKDAFMKANRFINYNDDRKSIKEKTLARAEKIIEKEGLSGDVPLIVNIPDTPSGILGIIAGNLAEEYKVPAIVLTGSNNTLHGSARSYGDYNLKEHLDMVRGHLNNYGGHAGAAGLSLGIEDFVAFKFALQKVSDDFVREDINDLYYDIEIKASQVPECIKLLSRYEPFGEGNPMPVFKVTDFNPLIPDLRVPDSYKKLLGSSQKTVKFSSQSCDAIAFNMANKIKDIDGKGIYSFVGTLSNNYYNGNVTSQIEFVDVIKGAPSM